MSNLIDGQDAIDAIMGEPSEVRYPCYYAEKIRNLPSAQKTGKNISKDGFLCSCCSFGDFSGFYGYKPRYCPNCGARIIGEEDD